MSAPDPVSELLGFHFAQAIRSGRLLLGDGALGTMLQAEGLPLGDAPERWNLERPADVARVHAAYAAAGAAWVQTNSFGGSRPRLEAGGLRASVSAVNEAAVRCAREGAPDLPVLGTLGPTGSPEAGVWRPAYDEQAEALAAAGAHGFLVETVVSLPEGLAAVRAAVEAGAGPVLVSFTPGEAGNLLDGTDAIRAAEAWVEAGASVVGVNCGAGPESLLQPARRLATAGLAPVLAAPSAGLPEVIDGRPVYNLSPDAFARAAIQFQMAGVRLFAGCCGTSPAHLQAAARALDGNDSVPRSA